MFIQWVSAYIVGDDAQPCPSKLKRKSYQGRVQIFVNWLSECKPRRIRGNEKETKRENEHLKVKIVRLTNQSDSFIEVYELLDLCKEVKQNENVLYRDSWQMGQKQASSRLKQ